MTTKRAKSAASTRSAILTAARLRFANEGYDRATVRMIADDAACDPALVIRYFGSKHALFVEAVSTDLYLPDFADVPPETFASALLERFFEIWERDPTFLGMLRASATSPEAAEAMRTLFSETIAPAIGKAVTDLPEARASIIGALLIGTASSRYIVKNPVLVAMDRDELSSWLEPIIGRLLTDASPGS